MAFCKFNSECRKEILKNLFIVIMCVGLSSAVNFFLISPKYAANELKNKKVEPPAAAVRAEKSIVNSSDIIADIVEKITPSVVHITTEAEQNIVNDPSQYFFQDEFFKHFFDFEIPQRNMPLKRKTQGTGSGVIISDNGYILTNYHVVQNATKIIVKNINEKEYQAKLVGKDQYSDLAVIKIEEKGLVPAKLSDSEKIRPGQWAIAVGSPHGLDHTVTLGIISAVRRDVPQLSNVSFLQTDAAINPGNSGGPLLNIKGEVVGINTAIIGTAQNIGFAIPIDTAKTILEQLKTGESIGHPWLGIAMGPLTAELANAIGVSAKTQGVVITKIIPNSPADAGGLQAGDIIQKINGKKILTPDELQNEIKLKKVNDNITLQVLREGQLLGVKIKLGNWGEN